MFGQIVVVVAVGVALALFATKITRRIGIPAPALFLAAAAVASDLFPELGDHVDTRRSSASASSR